jgi:hypothetical protein
MIRRFFPLMATLWATTLAAQGTVVTPEPVLDTGRAQLRDQLLQFRDTLNTIDAAAARLQRDYRNASAAALTSRAGVMRDACGRSARNVAPTRKVVVAAEVSGEARLKSRTELLKELNQLHHVIDRCTAEFGELSRPGQAEKVRGYANDRAVRVQGALRRYEGALSSFLSIMGIKVSPLGSKPIRASA